MELNKYIIEYNHVLPIEVIGALVNYASKENFKATSIITKDGEAIDKKVRNVECLPLGDRETWTKAHWHNLLTWAIKKHFKIYSKTFTCGTSSSRITSLEILKYEKDMFYELHTDYHLTAPRSVSAILYLNNDYEGGTTSFFHPISGEKIYEAKPEPAKLIMWPSNFMYPHAADPVTKGTRYVVVSWIS